MAILKLSITQCAAALASQSTEQPPNYKWRYSQQSFYLWCGQASRLEKKKKERKGIDKHIMCRIQPYLCWIGNSPDKTSARPSSASCLLTFVLISRPLRYAAMLLKPKIPSATVTSDKETNRNKNRSSIHIKDN